MGLRRLQASEYCYYLRGNCIARAAGSLTTLAKFETASFGYDYTSVFETNYAIVGASTNAIGSLPYQLMIMVCNNGRNLAAPSGLTSDGTSFTVSYVGK